MLTRRQLIGTSLGAMLVRPVLAVVAQEAAELQINSTRYIATNADTGAIFAQRGAHERVAIASLTKVFTAIEAVHLASLDTRITTIEDDLQPAEATVMGFGAGETFSLEELIYGMLLPSGNDAAHAIARALGGEEGDDSETAVQRFMDLVNQRVQDMGLQNTHLLNPDGWGVEGHYSSAADVAAFMAYASLSDFVLKVLGTKSYTTSNGYTVTNTNKVLTTAPSVIAGKTGYDDDSGWCLVQIAERGDTRVIAVTLDGVAPDDWYNDNLVLLDFGFEQQAALQDDEFSGEYVTWSNPDTSAYGQVGRASAAIVADLEPELTAVAETTLPEGGEPQSDSVATTAPAVVGREGDPILAGIGGAVLAGTATVSRWRDAGGDASMASIAESLAAVGQSLRAAILPARKAPPNVDNDSDAELPDLATNQNDEPLQAPDDIASPPADNDPR